MQKKLAVLTPVYTPYRGGIGVVAHANARMAAEGGYDTTILTPWYGWIRKRNIPARETDGLMAIRRLRPFISLGNAAVLPQLFWVLRSFQRAHFHYPFLDAALAMVLARFVWGTRYVVTYHMDLVGKKAYEKLIFRFTTLLFLPLIIKYADRIFISSLDYARQSRLAPFFARYRSKMVVLPHSVDTSVYGTASEEAKEAIREKHSLSSDQPVVLFVGGLDDAHYFKGVEYLLEAFEALTRMLENARRYPLPALILVGYGNLINHYQNLAGQLGIADKVIFTGRIAEEKDLAAYYSLAAATVLPSIDSSESFGLVLIESMACGTAVIASDLAGIRSVVRDSMNGYLVPPRTIERLAERMFELLNDPSRAHELGKNGRRIVEEEYSYTAVKQLFLKHLIP
ncbi:glycosyltransferase [Candidatus Uhrbacteria bacterium]|nr:glycosyltransferase [Candidatus Uhrbacteria bacterium]